MKNKENWAEEARNWGQRNPVIVLITILVLLISSFFTIIDGFGRAEDFYTKTFNWRKVEEGKINSLSASINIEKFIDILGTPLFKEKVDDLASVGKVEYTFKGRGYWVQAITDDVESVIFYSVTACDDNFKPKIYNNPLRKDITLRLSKFDIVEQPDDIYYFQGITANSYAFESAYLANPGNYQTIFYGINDVCSNDLEKIYDLPKECRWEKSKKDCLKNKEALINFRETHAINTLGITAPHLNFNKESDNPEEFQHVRIGVDRILVRVYLKK